MNSYQLRQKQGKRNSAEAKRGQGPQKRLSRHVDAREKGQHGNAMNERRT